MYSCYHTWENFGRENRQIQIVSSYLAKISLPIFADTPKMYFTYALTVAYLPIAITCMVHQNFPRQEIFHVWYITTMKCPQETDIYS